MRIRHNTAPHGQYPTRHERLADIWVHVAGIVFAAAGGGALAGVAYFHNEFGRARSVSAYVLCLLLLLSVSAASNLAYVIHHRRRLQNADETAIFLLIAGSYTPFTTQILHGALAIRLTLAVWGLAIGAALAKMFVSGISRRLWMLAYLLLGWTVIVAIEPLVRGLHGLPLALLVGGGLTYSLGTICYAAPKLRYRRAIWHAFVLAAATMHFVAILTGVVLA